MPPCIPPKIHETLYCKGVEVSLPECVTIQLVAARKLITTLRTDDQRKVSSQNNIYKGRA